MRLPRIAIPEAMGEYLRGTGFLPMTAEDTPETIARGVEALLSWLIDHAIDQPVYGDKPIDVRCAYLVRRKDHADDMQMIATTTARHC